LSEQGIYIAPNVTVYCTGLSDLMTIWSYGHLTDLMAIWLT